MKNNKKGFTLAELLVVVAIIAVLVAISIPIFSAQLEKSNEAVDAANIRAAYAEIMSDAASGKTDTTKQVTLTQSTDGWGGITVSWPSNLTVSDSLIVKGKTLTLKYTDGKVVAE